MAAPLSFLTKTVRGKSRPHCDAGFTLIELLVVILIIGLLAAIAIPAFLIQTEKAQDSDAKSNATNLVRIVQGCFVETQDYAQCQTADLDNVDLPLGADDGHVESINGTKNTFEVVAHSRSGGTFLVAPAAGTKRLDRTCLGNTHGCNSGQW